MYNGKHKSFKTVLWRALKHEFCSDLSEEQAAEYALELIRNLQLGFTFKDSVEYINVSNYRGKIPEDLVYIRGVRCSIDSLPIQFTTDTTPDFIKDEVVLDYLYNKVSFLPVKFTGDIYHSSYHCNGLEQTNLDDTITYTINNNYIYLSEKDAIIQLSYKGILLDNDGYPMIPDNQPFENALYYYILKEHLFGLWGIGKVTDKFYNKLEQDYAWYVGQATSNLKLAGMDNWEEAMNGIRRLIHDQNLSDNGYKALHNREQIKKTF